MPLQTDLRSQAAAITNIFHPLAHPSAQCPKRAGGKALSPENQISNS